MSSALPPASNPSTERTPLLPSSSPTSPPPAGTNSDEAPIPELTPHERLVSTLRWVAFWILFSVLVGVLVVKAVKEGGGKVDWWGALKKAGGGGLSGAMAMVIQVLALMPLRTIMNYQYRFGTTFVSATKYLYTQGGYSRYYAGLGAALFQGPIARFGDTAANVGIFALLNSNPYLKTLPSFLKTMLGSVAGAGFRMILVPLDTLKTTLQTQGSPQGLIILKDRIKAYGIGTLWYGAFATAAASFVGSYPWFATYNYLSEILPLPSDPSDTFTKLARLALMGFVASVVSDTVSNSLRVLKTYRQVNNTRISYRDAAVNIISSEGILGLLGRGLGTRILANGLQGIMFSILWKYFQELLA